MPQVSRQIIGTAARRIVSALDNMALGKEYQTKEEWEGIEADAHIIYKEAVKQRLKLEAREERAARKLD